MGIPSKVEASGAGLSSVIYLDSLCFSEASAMGAERRREQRTVFKNSKTYVVVVTHVAFRGSLEKNLRHPTFYIGFIRL